MTKKTKPKPPSPPCPHCGGASKVARRTPRLRYSCLNCDRTFAAVLRKVPSGPPCRCCGEPTAANGKHRNGKQRYYCKPCKKSVPLT